MKTEDRTDIGPDEKAIWKDVEKRAKELVKDEFKAAALLAEIERTCGREERERFEIEVAKGDVPPLQTAHVLTVVDAWLAYN